MNRVHSPKQSKERSFTRKMGKDIFFILPGSQLKNFILYSRFSFKITLVSSYIYRRSIPAEKRTLLFYLNMC